MVNETLSLSLAETISNAKPGQFSTLEDQIQACKNTTGCNQVSIPVTNQTFPSRFCTNIFPYMDFSSLTQNYTFPDPASLPSNFQSHYAYSYWFVSNAYNPQCNNPYNTIYQDIVLANVNDQKKKLTEIYIDGGFTPEFIPSTPSAINTAFLTCLIVAVIYYIMMNEVVISFLMDFLSLTPFGKYILERL